jgi:HTH-like domain
VRASETLAVSTQCRLLAVTRSVVYDRKNRLQRETGEIEGMLLQLLDEEYTRHPFYGTRRMTKYLCGCGYAVNRKRVQRLMQKLGLAGMAPGPEYEQGASAAQGLSVPVAGHGDHSSQSGLEYGYHLHTAGARLCLPGGDYRLV